MQMETGEFPQQVGFQISSVEVVFLSTTRSKFVVFLLQQQQQQHSLSVPSKLV